MNTRTLFSLVALAVLACVSGAHPWAQERSDSSRSQQSPDPGPQTGDLFWKYSLPYETRFLAASGDGQIYTSATFDNNWWNGEFYSRALRPDGSLAWRKKLIPYPWGFSQDNGPSPAITPTGEIVLASTNAELIKMASNAVDVWKKAGDNWHPNGISPAVLSDGRIFWMFGSSIKSYTPAGDLIWESYSTGANMAVSNNGEIMVEQNRTTGSSTSNARYYLNSDGTLRWAQSAFRGGTGRPWVQGNDGRVYDGMRAMNISDGSIAWADPTPIGPIGGALGKNGQVYGYNTDIRAYAKATGEVLWTTAVGPVVKHIAIDSNDRLYAVTSTGEVVALSPQGAILWRKQICDSFLTGPIIGPNSTLLACGKKGNRIFIYCIR